MRAVGCIGAETPGSAVSKPRDFYRVACRRHGVSYNTPLFAIVSAIFQDIALDSARNYFFDQAFYAATTNTSLPRPAP